MSSVSIAERSATERVLEALRRSGNPFRNYFARNPDDEVCARYHVPELFAPERDLLLSIVDLYRYDPMTHSEVVPVLGNKGAGKTHLLHSIKHGTDGAWQLLVTPGVYQKDTEFLEYLLFQIIDTLLGGGRQKGVRPLEYVGDQLMRRLLSTALRELTTEQRLDLFPPPGLGRWTRRLGLGHGQAQERAQWLADNLSGYGNLSRTPTPILQALSEAGLDAEQALDLALGHIEKTEAHNTAGLMRRAIFQGFAKAILLKEEAELANFLTYGFAELDFQVRPTRQDLVLALFKVLMEIFRSLKTPVVVAFDQLEDLLLARRSDDAHRIAEAFFAGIVQVMHQIDGLCFLIFAERGLWNRFVPSLDGYIQDRLNNPVHVPRHGTVKALRLEAPSPDLVRRVVEARLRPVLDELPDDVEISDIYPFVDDQIIRIARTEPTLRDMLQQFRHLFDHLVYGSEGGEPRPLTVAAPVRESSPVGGAPDDTNANEARPSSPILAAVNRIAALEAAAPTTLLPQSSVSNLVPQEPFSATAASSSESVPPTEPLLATPADRPIDHASAESQIPTAASGAHLPAAASEAIPSAAPLPTTAARHDTFPTSRVTQLLQAPDRPPLAVKSVLIVESSEPADPKAKTTAMPNGPSLGSASSSAASATPPASSQLPSGTTATNDRMSQTSPQPTHLPPAASETSSQHPAPSLSMPLSATPQTQPTPMPQPTPIPGQAPPSAPTPTFPNGTTSEASISPSPTFGSSMPSATSPYSASNLVPGVSAEVSLSAAPITRAMPQPSSVPTATLIELWEQEQRSARRKLEPEGALTGATRELQAGLGMFLQVCHEHGVKVGPWRLQHVVGEYTFGDHPTYGAVTIAHWACKDGQPWKVGIGLFLARGAGKPKDLEVKLSVMDSEPAVIDHLILLRPEDDLTLTGKSKTLWQDAERRGKHARIEPVSIEGFALLSSFPRWLATVTESMPEGQPVPNLADLIQEVCEKLLEQVCMPVQG